MEKKHAGADFKKIDLLPVFSDITGEIMVTLFFNEKIDQNLYKGMTISQAICSLLKRMGDAIFSAKGMIFGPKGVRKFGLFKDIYQDIRGIRTVIHDMVV